MDNPDVFVKTYHISFHPPHTVYKFDKNDLIHTYICVYIHTSTLTQIMIAAMVQL